MCERGDIEKVKQSLLGCNLLYTVGMVSRPGLLLLDIWWSVGGPGVFYYWLSGPFFYFAQRILALM